MEKILKQSLGQEEFNIFFLSFIHCLTCSNIFIIIIHLIIQRRVTSTLTLISVLFILHQYRLIYVTYSFFKDSQEYLKFANSIIDNCYHIPSYSQQREIMRMNRTPPRILSVQGKKLEQDGTISYFVRYQGYKSFNWASKNYLYLLKQNQNCIDAFEKLSRVATAGKPNPSKEKQKKTGGKTRPVMKKQIKGDFVRKYIQPNEANTNNPFLKLEERKRKRIKKKSIIKEDSQKNKNSKTSETRSLDISCEQSQYNNLKAEELFSKMISKFKDSFIIIKGSVSQSGEISFLIQFGETNRFWVKGDQVKKIYPFKVINFYQQKIIWAC